MRKTKTITITAEGRDKGKVFVVREMDSDQGERWGIRMFEALAKSGADIPASIGDPLAGLAGLYMLGFRAVLGAPSEITLPLLDEMFRSCVSVVPDPKEPNVYRGAPLPGMPEPAGLLIPDDTEELATRALLRSEVFELHTGFSIAAFLSERWAAAKAKLDESGTTSTTETSDPSAEPSSQSDSPA